MNNLLKSKLLPIGVPLIAALLSVFLLAGAATSGPFYRETLAALEEKQTTVLELTAASTAASAAITLLPGDAGSPIADKLADLSAGFLLVLCAIFLEKYLLTITAWVTFYWLIPAACALYIAHALLRRRLLAVIARRLVLLGIVIVLVIPASVSVSRLIEETYHDSIQSTIESAAEATEEIQDQAEDEGFWSGLISSVTAELSGLSDRVSGLINRFLEALAVMIVTACLIPLLVLVFFVWLARMLLGLDAPANPGALFRGARGPSPREDGTE